MTKPNDEEIARFQAQLALALLKRQLNTGEHLSAEQLAQLLTHSAPPEVSAQWKQHLNDCNDCYGVFLDVAQAHMLHAENNAPNKSLLQLEFSRWRYVLGFGLPTVLVAALYFSWPQQQLVQTAIEQTQLSDTAIKLERAPQADRQEVPTKPKAATGEQFRSAQVDAGSAIPKEATVEAIQPSAAPIEMSAAMPEISTPASAESISLQSPLISGAANEQRAKLDATQAQRENDTRENQARVKQQLSDREEMKSVSAAPTMAQSTPMTLAKSNARPVAEAAPAAAIRDERFSETNQPCSNCDADEQFDADLKQWATSTIKSCTDHQFTLTTTRDKWRELLTKHNTVKRDQLLNLNEPTQEKDWCELATKISSSL